MSSEAPKKNTKTANLILAICLVLLFFFGIAAAAVFFCTNFQAGQNEEQYDETTGQVFSSARSKAANHEYAAALIDYANAIRPVSYKKKKELLDSFCKALQRQEKTDPRIAQAGKLLKAGKYKELDELARELVDKKESYWNVWKIEQLVDNLGARQLRDAGEESSEAYEQQLKELRSWLKANPDSSCARCSLAECYVAYAWFARGSGYADTVSDEGWKFMRERLAKAEAVLTEDKDIWKKTPSAFSTYSTIALGTGLEKDRYMKLVDECHHLWPDFNGFDRAACYFLLPRWYGEPGEWEQFAASRADQIGGAAGDAYYAKLASQNLRVSGNIFRENSGLSWPRIKNGFKKIFADYPSSMNARIAYIKFAQAAADMEALKTTFDGYQLADKY